MNVKESIFLVYEIVILTSAVASLLWWKDLRNKQLLWFVPYLWYVFLQEFFSHHFYKQLFGSGSNDIVYNIYRFVTVLFFSRIYYRLPFMKLFRKYIAGMAILYGLAFFIIFGFLQSIFTYNGYLGLARGFVVSVTGLFFLFAYFHIDNRQEEKFWQPWLWITMGILLFYPVVSISLTFMQHLLALDTSLWGIRVYNLIPQLMSIVMYSFFTYAFYLCKRKN